jgi:hypothetical protein
VLREACAFVAAVKPHSANPIPAAIAIQCFSVAFLYLLEFIPNRFMP